MIIFEAFRVLMKLFILGTYGGGLTDAIIEFYVVAGVMGFGFLGAKHRDTSVLFAYILSAGFCFLFFCQVVYQLTDELINKEALTGDAAKACQANPECDENTLNGIKTHPLDSIPLYVLWVLWACATFYAYQLWSHKSSGKEMRSSDTGQKTVGGRGGPSFPVMVTINPQDGAQDEVAAAEAAYLQTMLYNLVALLVIFEVLRAAVKVFFIATQSWDSALTEFYAFLTPFGLTYIGAKHRDKNVLFFNVISSGFCFLFFLTVTYEIVVNFFSAPDAAQSDGVGDTITAEERRLCSEDPECDEEELKIYLRHPLDAIPELAITALFGVLVFYTYKLWKHPTSNQEMRVVSI